MIVLAVGCGKKGPPLPPLVRLPVAPGEVSVVRRGTTADIHLVIPKANTDGSTPADVARVDVYALSSAEAVTDDEVVRRGTRVGSVEVKPPPDPDEDPDAPRPEGEKEAPGVEQGTSAGVSDTIAPAAGELRYYVSAGVNTRGRRGPLSPRAAISLAPAPPAPAPPSIAYTESEITVSWGAAAGDASPAVHVYDTAGDGRRLTAEPVSTRSFVDRRVEWGAERCYALRTVVVDRDLPVEGELSEPACVTLKDTFPPAAPTGLTAVAGEGSVNLIWNANTEPDLGGYIVLRARAGGTPEAVTPSPITETTFRDTAPAGERFVYAIEAVDKVGNASPMSERVEETPR